MDTALFKNVLKRYPLIVQIYVDDTIFSDTSKKMCKDFSELIKGESAMSMIGELKFFLWLQIIYKDDGMFIHQEKNIQRTF